MKKLIGILIGATLLTLVFLRLYQEMSPGKPGTPSPAVSSQATLLVETATVSRHLFQSDLEVRGELAPLASVEVMSRINGRLEEVLVERGDAVRQGQLLAVVDDVDLQQQIRRAEAAVSVARAAVNREEASHQNLELQLARARRLHEERLISAQEIEDVESRFRVSQAQLELVRAQVEQARAALRELVLEREQTRIYSPLDGFVGNRHLDPGALVNASTPIVSVLDLARLKTVVPVQEAVLGQIRVGQPATILVDAYPGRTHRGRVRRISPFLDPDTRSADVEIEIPNPEGTLKPGMSARVQIDIRVPTPALSIPRSALLTRGEAQGVYLLGRDSTTVFHPIRIGRIDGPVIEVTEGLEEGTRVVATGAQNLNDGDRVRVQ